MTEATTPPDGAVSAAAAARLAALRAPSKSKGRPARSSKILAAGMSTTVMLGMVTAMGWPRTSHATQTTPTPATTIVAPPATVVPLVPAATVPTAVEATSTTPVTIPTAIPITEAPAPAATGPITSNTTTKASG